MSRSVPGLESHVSLEEINITKEGEDGAGVGVGGRRSQLGEDG